MKLIYSLIGWTLVCLLGACRPTQTTASLSEGDTLHFAYATHLQVVRYDSFTVAEMRNPWDTTRLLRRYILVPKTAEMPSSHPEGMVVQTPLQRAGLYSSVHCNLLKEMGMLHAIKGVCDLKYVMLDTIQSMVQQGLIHDYGNGMNVNLEQIIATSPDALMPSPFENSGGYGRLENLGIPIIECADYMESSALGRAEWMRFYGLLFGCEQRADSMFREVAHRYNTLKESVKNISTRPTLLCEKLTGTVWYVPGGHSTMGRLIEDAGAIYPFAYHQTTGSVPLSFETVLDRAGEADVWVMTYNAPKELTYEALATDQPTYTHFRPFRERRIYGCNTSRIPYYEETTFFPDRMLADLIQILHPSLRTSDKLHYFCPIE